MVVWYILPEYGQAKKTIYDGMTYDGLGYVDYYIPKEAIKAKNGTELKITLVNGSIIQLIGSSAKPDSLRGAGPTISVFSEAAFQDQASQAALLPMITANPQGICVYVTTPNGKNWFHHLWNNVQDNPDWFTYLMTVEETGHIPISEVEKLETTGQLSHEAIQSEFYCSWDRGVEGSVYGRAIQDMKMKKQIGHVPYDPDYLVNVSFDLGVKDPCALVFFQVIDRVIHIIDCYSATDQPYSHYVKVMKDKPYVYDQYFFPHDVFQRDQTNARSRYEAWVNLGIQPSKAGGEGKHYIDDGIECVRSSLVRTWIDEIACKDLIKSLENYHFRFDAKKNVYSKVPVHNQWSHYADAVRYAMISVPLVHGTNSTPEELDKRYKEAMYGYADSHLPAQFQGGRKF